MAAQARATINTPMSTSALRRAQEMSQHQQSAQTTYGGIDLPRRTPAPGGQQQEMTSADQPVSMQIPGEQIPPPTTAAAAEPALAPEITEQPQMIPVDSIVIPESDTEEAPAQSAAAKDDDDDVVVKVPTGSGRRRRK